MIKENLLQYFNFHDFKSGQEEVVAAILAKQDVVALMPTGGGKSLCYQLPAVINDGVTIVISPLIALMKDQVDSLQARNIEAAFINSSQGYDQIQEIIKELKNRQIKILYIAPERLKNEKFLNLFNSLPIDFVAVDEAHCVSSWGHDFRPDYMKIKDFIARFYNRPVVAAFTATATPEVRVDIEKHLNLRKPRVFIRGFDRPNLTFLVRHSLSESQRQEEAMNVIQDTEGSGIIYALTRKKTEELARLLNSQGIKAVAYHAGLDSVTRSKVQEDFMQDKYTVIVATVAFGMGVNKADIRFVIHFGMPGSLENYYQEAGRAGRDGEPAKCVLLNAKRDKALHWFFIKNSREELQKAGKNNEEIQSFINIKSEKLNKMLEYVENQTCRRKSILEYFADPDLKKYGDNCGGCDVCLGYKSEPDEAQKKAERKRKKHPIKRSASGEISDTVLQTAELYKKKFSLEQIAKIRELGKRTIWDHLVAWYASGGDFDANKYITEPEQEMIIKAMKEAGSYLKLKPIKDLVDDRISYEQIKIVIAKIERTRIKNKE